MVDSHTHITWLEKARLENVDDGIHSSASAVNRFELKEGHFLNFINNGHRPDRMKGRWSNENPNNGCNFEE